MVMLMNWRVCCWNKSKKNCWILIHLRKIHSLKRLQKRRQLKNLLRLWQMLAETLPVKKM